ncbi:hypothetical protein NUW54_g14442 [Trametes sanguinea]|uniref:Uncharacterized protein n=1 Tax=Trametes sanguinea TaxID=158606 RepID=A0ACC1MCQ4_9APHY|nr:hypothetical protein NUW54_g14442 [Trametes sanguinea]
MITFIATPRALFDVEEAEAVSFSGRGEDDLSWQPHSRLAGERFQTILALFWHQTGHGSRDKIPDIPRRFLGLTFTIPSSSLLARRSVIHPKLARELGALGVRALTRLDVELSNTGSCIARAASPILATSARYVTTVGDSTNRAFRFSKSIDRESMTYDLSACRLQHSQPSQPETL